MKKAREAASIPAGILRSYHLPGDIYAGRSVREREREDMRAIRKKKKRHPAAFRSRQWLCCLCVTTTDSNPEGCRDLKRARAPTFTPEFKVLSSSRLT